MNFVDQHEKKNPMYYQYDRGESDDVVNERVLAQCSREDNAVHALWTVVRARLATEVANEHRLDVHVRHKSSSPNPRHRRAVTNAPVIVVTGTGDAPLDLLSRPLLGRLKKCNVVDFKDGAAMRNALDAAPGGLLVLQMFGKAEVLRGMTVELAISIHSFVSRGGFLVCVNDPYFHTTGGVSGGILQHLFNKPWTMDSYTSWPVEAMPLAKVYFGCSVPTKFHVKGSWLADVPLGEQAYVVESEPIDEEDEDYKDVEKGPPLVGVAVGAYSRGHVAYICDTNAGDETIEMIVEFAKTAGCNVLSQ